MRIKLYKPFEHWYHGGTIFLYADPHFDDMDLPNLSSEEQVKNINSKVGKNDTIIFLGDIGNEEWIKKVRGYKVLLLGNHDKGATNYLKVYQSCLDYNPLFESTDMDEVAEFNLEYHLDFGRWPVITNNHMFDEVYEGPLFISSKILLSHEPIDLQFGLNIYGHDHNASKNAKEKYKTSFKGNKAAGINICGNLTDYTPVRLDELVDSVKIKDIHDVYRLKINRDKK